MNKHRIVIWAAVSKPDKHKPSDPDVKDKYSLKDQELLGLAFAKENEYEVVKIFRWPGHSRDESDVVQALEDFAKVGRLEYQELRALWRAKAFDVLWCHNHSRLGRSFTLQSWVIENVIRSGARVYRYIGGWIDENDYGGQIALGGWANTQERGRRLANNDSGLTERAKKGLNLNHVPFPHHIIRDPMDGKPLRMEVDPANRLFLDHLHRLMMDGIPMKLLGRELFVQFGHANPSTGRAWGSHMLYAMLHRPTFWGHSARKFWEKRRTLYYDCWGFDESAPVPEGVDVYRNTHEPAYTGKQAQEVQSAIRFYKHLKGTPDSHKVHRLSGIVFCPECYHQMHFNQTSARHNKFYYIHCPTHYEFIYHHSAYDCNNTQHIREGKVQQHIDDILHRAFDGEDIVAILGETNEPPLQHIKHLEAEIGRQETLIGRLILQSAKSSETLSEHYDRLLKEADEQLQQMQADLKQLTQETEFAAHERMLQTNALADLKVLSVENLWIQDNITVNRLLRDLFGRHAIFVLDGSIVGINVRPRRGKGRGTPYVRE